MSIFAIYRFTYNGNVSKTLNVCCDYEIREYVVVYDIVRLFIFTYSATKSNLSQSPHVATNHRVSYCHLNCLQCIGVVQCRITNWHSLSLST